MLYLPCLIYPPGLLCSYCSSTQELEQEAWVCSSSAIRVPPWWSECCSPGQSFLEAVLPRTAMFCDPRPQTGQPWYVGTGCFGQAPPLPACMQYVVSYTSGLLPVLVQNGSPTPHKTGCKLTLEFQLFLFSASGHFHVGIGSFCEKGLWRRMYLEKPISLGQGPGPALSFPLEDFVGNFCTWHLGLERERAKADSQTQLQTHNHAHSDCFAACRTAPGALGAQRWPVTGGHHNQGSEASGAKATGDP